MANRHIAARFYVNHDAMNRLTLQIAFKYNLEVVISQLLCGIPISVYISLRTKTHVTEIEYSCPCIETKISLLTVKDYEP